jgi:hypothetical protein
MLVAATARVSGAPSRSLVERDHSLVPHEVGSARHDSGLHREESASQLCGEDVESRRAADPQSKGGCPDDGQ